MLFKKEVRDILRERTIIMALATQLFVAAFSAFLTVGLVSLYDPSAVRDMPDTQVAYVGPGDLEPYLATVPNLDVVEEGFEDAVAAFQRGEVDGVIEETYADEDGTRSITLMLPQDEVQATLLINQLKDVLGEYEQDLREDRQHRLSQEVIYVDADVEANIYVGFAYSVLLPLLVATPIFLAGAITGDSISDEINNKSLLLLRASPLSTSEIVIGKLAAPVLLAPAQVILWLMLLEANDLPISNEPALLGLSLVLALFLAAASTMLALVVRKEGHTQAVYALFVLVVGTLAVLLPQQPLNIIARLAVDTADAVTYATLGLYTAAALAALA
ncbi:MAG: ABC transporter permease, partial [Candidatus Thermoplasmatota archaeon]|nr:ABC transporter permease [Candidatus Thermoplasmatota archaeon]